MGKRFIKKVKKVILQNLVGEVNEMPRARTGSGRKESYEAIASSVVDLVEVITDKYGGKTAKQKENRRQVMLGVRKILRPYAPQ